MKPERYKQIEELYHAALSCKPEERLAFLERACDGDAALRVEVESLIGYDERAAKFIETPPADIAAAIVAAEPPHALVGRILGHYRVVSLLGAGGMGEVFLGEDTRLGRKVAIKILPQNFIHDEKRILRFKQEARAVSALNHPNILTLHDIGEDNSTLFIVTEFVQGETLRQRLSGERLPLTEAIDIATQIAQALAAAHQVGIIHRDIKPENIILRTDRYVKVLDFGLAKLAEPQVLAQDSSLLTSPMLSTEPGLMMGTTQYMTPEQMRGLEVDNRADIFSLGVVLYEMITGARPFIGATGSDLIVAVLQQSPLPLVHYTPEAPTELQRIITRALHKNKEERYQVIEELIADLKGLERQPENQSERRRSTLPMPDPRTESPTKIMTASQVVIDTPKGQVVHSDMALAQDTLHTGHYFTKLKGRQPLALIALAAIMLILSGGAYWLIKRLNQPPPPSPVQISRLTSIGRVPIAAVSPDGKYIVYVQKDGDKQSLWLKQVSTTSAAQIAPPIEGGYSGLIFSQDGNYIYYTLRLPPYDLRRSGDLYQMPILGGTARKLISDLRSCITLSPDGQQIAFIRMSTDNQAAYLMTAKADGSEEQKVAERVRPAFFEQISWSPDGKVIACGVFDPSQSPAWSLVGVSPQTGVEQSLSTQRWDLIGFIEWLRDGSGLIVNANDQLANPTQLWKIAYPQAEAQKITTNLDQYRGVSITADGRSLVSVQDTRLTNIYIIEPGADPSSARMLNSEIISSNQGGAAYDWTPDGKIVYTASLSGTYELWIMEADGTGNRQLTVDAYARRLSVSPDGRYIVFGSYGNRGFHIWRADITGGNLKQLTNGGGEAYPKCSPDGKWVVYESMESSEARSWKVPIDGGEPVPISDKGFFRPSISPDGKLMANLHNDKQNNRTDLVITNLETGKPIKTLNVSYIQWMPDSRNLLCYSSQDKNILKQPIDGGPPKPLTSFQSEFTFACALSPDGKHLVLSRGSFSSDVVLIRFK